MIPLLCALLAAGAPVAAGTLHLPESDAASGIPGEGLRTGRVGGLVSIFVEVRMDGVFVEGEPVLVLRDGQAPRAEGDERLLRPVYERLLAKVAAREALGARGPFLAVLAIDGRVEAGTLARLTESLRQARVERVAILVTDRTVTGTWTPPRLPAGANELRDPSYALQIRATREGFRLVEAGSMLTARDVRGLACSPACESVDDLPWDALERVLTTRLAPALGQDAIVGVVTPERDLPAEVLVRAAGLAAAHFQVVTVDVLPDPILGGGLEVSASPEPLSLDGRLEALSVVLPHVPDAQRVTGIPAHAIERAFGTAIGRTRACLAQGGSGTEVDVRIEVDEDGQVQAATVVRSTTTAVGPGECLLRVVRGLSFPAPSGDPPFVLTRTFNAER